MNNLFLKSLIVVVILSLNLYATVSQKQCEQKGDGFIFASNECIQFYTSKGDTEDQITILVHGTWPAGTNILARYSTFAQDLSLQTDITTIAIALPGYSKSSTNNFKALAHKGADNPANKKEYIQFLSNLTKALKKRFNAKIVNYVGHSAGAKIGAKLVGLSSNLIKNIILVGGTYDIGIQTLDKKTNYTLVYGTKDKISEPSITKEFYKKLKKINLNAQIVEVKDGIHLDLDMTDESLDAIIELLED